MCVRQTKRERQTDIKRKETEREEKLYPHFYDLQMYSGLLL